MKRSTRQQWAGGLSAAVAVAVVYSSWAADPPALGASGREHQAQGGSKPGIASFGHAASRPSFGPAGLTAGQPSSSIPPASRSEYLRVITAARTEAAEEHWAKASDAYGRAGALVPESLEAALGEQHALIQQTRYAESEKVAKRVLKRDPANYWSRLWLAWALFNRRQYRDAASLYEEVLSGYPSELEPAIGLGYAQLYSGQRARAAATFGSVLARFPRDSQALAGAALAR